MTILQAVILGFAQGFTEFLPVSSSGHLIFIPILFGWPDQGVVFDLVLHLGTLLAVIIYFRKKLWTILFSCFVRETSRERRLGWLILFSTIPAGIFGLLLDTNRQSPLVIGVNMIAWGLLLGAADWFSSKQENKKSIEQVTWKETAIMACAQALALIPGTSRSGVTMTAGLFGKLSKTAAAEFSFLMSVPIIALAGVSKAYELFQGEIETVPWSFLGLGFLVSFASGFLAIWGLMKIIQRWSFWPFVAYRVLVGIAILVILV